MKQLQAVIFDMDGVLIESEPLWRRVEVKVFAEEGLTLSEEDCAKTTGLRTKEVVAFRAQSFSFKRSIEQIAQRIEEEVQELIIREGQGKAGACELVAEIAKAGIPLALCSSSPMKLIDAVLDKLQLRSYFSVIHSAEFETKGKPDPSVYLSTIKKLKLSSSAIVAIEDSPNGVRAALAAGLRCIALPEEHDRVLVRTLTQHVVGTLEELSTIEIEKVLSRS